MTCSCMSGLTSLEARKQQLASAAALESVDELNCYCSQHNCPAWLDCHPVYNLAQNTTETIDKLSQVQ